MKRYFELALKLIRASVAIVFAYVTMQQGDPSLILDAVEDSVKAVRALTESIANAVKAHEIDKQHPRHVRSRPY